MFEEKFVKQDELLVNIKARLPTLEILLQKVSSPNDYEDPIYRFYYQSFKVYWLQSGTKEIVEELRNEIFPRNGRKVWEGVRKGSRSASLRLGCSALSLQFKIDCSVTRCDASASHLIPEHRG
ncbi:MAG: hypothetical protein NTV79_03270 [Candidatus Aureabacteria bacterium]|nr:hypothetical protein [Candidatus Auribacterota bacterium]